MDKIWKILATYIAYGYCKLNQIAPSNLKIILHSLKVDKNGACFVVYPDCPPCLMPDNNLATVLAMVGFGQYLAEPLSFETFKWKHAFVVIFTILVLIYLLFCVLF